MKEEQEFEVKLKEIESHLEEARKIMTDVFIVACAATESGCFYPLSKPQESIDKAYTQIATFNLKYEDLLEKEKQKLESRGYIWEK